MAASADLLKDIRVAMKAKEWPRARDTLRQMYPQAGNSKFIGDLMKTAALEQREGRMRETEELLWLVVEIYESGRDENSEVVTAIRLLAEMYKREERQEEYLALCDRTFNLVLTTAEGLNRIVKSLTRQLSDQK